MARLDGNMVSTSLGRGGFAFTGARIDRLEATDYTLVTIAIDATGSVSPFVQDLDRLLKEVVAACRKSARSENLLVRIIFFGSQFQGGVFEVIGFTPLADVDPATFPNVQAGGMTPLCDAAFSALAATNKYADDLRKNDFGVNAIIFIISDGGENSSISTMKMVQDEQKLIMQSEQLESCLSILIGVNTAQCGGELSRFQQEAGMSQYLDGGAATPGQIAKVAQFVSRSISSQSQALGTGGPSQQISATI